ncbi:hypothetical protein HDV05_002181 [Chytridiales sp. JEL 0842]|nr:hypothetical protein HDV05_002181 [Chytridiales sp. JEL 0842]
MLLYFIPIRLPWPLEPLVNFTAVLTLGASFLLWKFQSKLIYMPSLPPGSRTTVATPDQLHFTDWEDVEIKAADGVKLKMYTIYSRSPTASSVAASEGSGTWEHVEKEEAFAEGLRDRTSGTLKPSSSSAALKGKVGKTTVLYLHANAGNMGHRLPIAYIFWKRMRCNVVMLSYRGYGLSEGTSDEKGLKLDAEAALEYIKSHPELKDSKVILYGQSIGGAVAIHLASHSPAESISGLIIENTFLSIPKLIPHVFPVLKNLLFLCHQKWDSEKAFESLPSSVPVLMLSGKKDELIPQAHMLALLKKLREVRMEKEMGVRFVEFEGGTHNDTCLQPGYFDAVEEWLKEVLRV